MAHGPKMTTLIFRSEIRHDGSTNVVYLFRSDVLLFTRKFAKIVQDADHYKEGLNGVNRQPSKGLKINRQPSKTEYFYRQPSNERAKISRQTSQISLNDRDRLT